MMEHARSIITTNISANVPMATQVQFTLLYVVLFLCAQFGSYLYKICMT